MRKATEHTAGDLIIDKEEFDQPLMAVPQHWPVPKKIDFDGWVLPASSQGNDPACAGFAVNGYAEYINWRKHLSMAQLPGLKTYNEAKLIDGFKGPGTHLRFAIQAAQTLGYIPEEWVIQRLASPKSIKFAMHRYGYIAICGLNITEGWNNADNFTGAIDETKPESIGGHAVLATSYDSEKQIWRGANSWGTEWGDEGFWQMSEAAFDKQLMTAVVVRKKEE